MKEKILSIEDAASQVRNGDQIVMSARLDWAPMALLRQLIRQGTRNLKLVGVVGGDINLDILVGAGAAGSVDTCSVHLGPFAGTAPNFARHVTQGRVKAMDNTWGVLYTMIQAGSMGAPYVPVMGLVGSDLLKRREDMKILPNPFDPTQESVVAKAYRPDVALLHGHKADRAGNVSIGYHNEDTILAEASRRVIVSVEELVDELPESESQGTYLPSILVDTVVHAPFGAHPAGCPGYYPVDEAHMRRYTQAAASDETFAQYLRETVFEVDSHSAYLERFVIPPVGIEGTPARAGRK